MMRELNRYRWFVACAAWLMLAAVQSADARSFRQISPIAMPSALPANAQQVVPAQRPDRDLVTEGVNQILDAWNQGALGNVLAEDFVNGQQLADTVTTVVPRDARLSLQALRAWTLLKQYRLEEPGESPYRISRVAVTVRLQLTFNDPVNGYQKMPGTSELILEIREPI